MKAIYYLIIVVLTALPAGVFADSSYNDWLNKLDKSLAQRDQYEQKRLGRIDTLKSELSKIKQQPNIESNDRYYDLLYGLYNEYKSYCYDSAHHYANECLDVALLNKNDERIVEASNAVAFTLISAGILTEAHEVLNSIDRNKVSGKHLNDYYEHYSQLWRSLADYVREEPFYTKYITKSNAYLDSLMQVTTPNSAKW